MAALLDLVLHPLSVAFLICISIVVYLSGDRRRRNGTVPQIKITNTNDEKPLIQPPVATRTPGTWPPSAFVPPCPKPLLNWNVHTSKPIPYRPMRYGPDYNITMGIRKMEWDEWIELDNQWLKFHNDKRARLAEREDKIVIVQSQAEDAARELLESLSRYVIHRYPSLFQYTQCEKGRAVRISATDEVYPLDNLPAHDAMRTAALLIQDDIALMIEDANGAYFLRAGAFILPGFWRVKDKVGMSLEEIHTSGDVPKFKEKLQTSMERYFVKMKPETPVLRNNYFIQTDDNLGWSSSIGSEDTDGVGWKHAKVDPPVEDIYFRSERQSLTRLPKSGAIAFTVRTYFIPITEMCQEPHIPGRLASAIRSWPDDVSLYKGKASYNNVLLPYLDKVHQEQKDSGLIDCDEGQFNYPY